MRFRETFLRNSPSLAVAVDRIRVLRSIYGIKKSVDHDSVFKEAVERLERKYSFMPNDVGKRRYLLQEFLFNEATYFHAIDVLSREIIMKLRFFDMASDCVVEMDTLINLFSNLEDIRDITEMLLRSIIGKFPQITNINYVLEEALDEDADRLYEAVLGAMKKHKDRFAVYAIFSANLPAALARFDALCQSNKEFSALIQSTELIEGFSIRETMEVVTCRLPQYAAFLRYISKSYPDEEKHGDGAKQAKSLRNRIVHIFSPMNNVQYRLDLANLQEVLFGGTCSIIDSSRHLLHSTRLQLIPNGVAIDRHTKGKLTLHLVLCNDCILATSDVGRLEHVVQLHKVKVESTGVPEALAFRVYTKDFALVLQAQTILDKKTTISRLSKAIETYKQTHGESGAKNVENVIRGTSVRSKQMINKKIACIELDMGISIYYYYKEGNASLACIEENKGKNKVGQGKPPSNDDQFLYSSFTDGKCTSKRCWRRVLRVPGDVSVLCRYHYQVYAKHAERKRSSFGDVSKSHESILSSDLSMMSHQ